MNEHGYIKAVHRHVPHPTYSWKINDAFAGGIADAFYCDSGGVLFVEYKYEPKIPKRPDTYLIPKLSPLQTNWLRDRYHQNIPIGVILGTPIGGVFFTGLSWEVGIPKSTLEEVALSTEVIGRIILDHCKGHLDVNTHEQTYPNTTRS